MNVRRLSLVAGLTLLVLAGAWAQNKSSSWRWPDSMDAVAASPQNHRVLYEDENIRILEVTTQPGTKNNMHDHKWPSVFINDRMLPKGKDYTWDGKVTTRERSPADAPYPLMRRMGPQEPHAFENLDTFPMHFYRMEFKKLEFKGLAGAEASPTLSYGTVTK